MPKAIKIVKNWVNYSIFTEQMKYHRLHIDLDGTVETYNKITQLLELEPATIDMDSKFGQTYSLWTYEVDINDEDEYFDFINTFLDILEPKFTALEELGVKKNNILFWLIYEYDQQCAMEFHPQEMKRLGESDIHLNIDCWAIKS